MSTSVVPTIGMVVKLRKGMLTLSARQIQHIKAVKRLEVGKGDIFTQADANADGGYWIKTEYTGGEWWAWSHFRVA
jgi:hypothetical protein